MKNYYQLLDIRPNANQKQVQAIFRKFIARYRPTLTTEQLGNDTQFHGFLNAYLTLYGDGRTAYDKMLESAEASRPPAPRPFEKLSMGERQLLLARVAYWRRDFSEAIHQLRSLLERQSDYAQAWALLGEIHLTIGRIGEGVKAYRRAVQHDPKNASYATRLQQAQDAEAGIREITVESTPEEEILREERGKRWRVTLAIGIAALMVLGYSYILPTKHATTSFLNIPWVTIFVQALGAFLLLGALAYGRLIDSFDREMIWSTIVSGDRGTLKPYPVGLIFFVSAVASLWLSVVAIVIMRLLDEEWPVSAGIMIGICALLNVFLALGMHFGVHLSWGTTALFGGNIPLLAAMLGWWAGSYGTSQD